MYISFSSVALEVRVLLRLLHQRHFSGPFVLMQSILQTALSSRACLSADSTVMGFCLFLASFSIVEASSRKSTWVPTSKNGVFGQWWVISGTHWKGRKLATSVCRTQIHLKVLNKKFKDFSRTLIFSIQCKNEPWVYAFFSSFTTWVISSWRSFCVCFFHFQVPLKL